MTNVVEAKPHRTWSLSSYRTYSDAKDAAAISGEDGIGVKRDRERERAQISYSEGGRI